MTRITTLAALLTAAFGLSACMSNNTGTTGGGDLTSGVSNPGEEVDTGDAVATPTDGIEDNPRN